MNTVSSLRAWVMWVLVALLVLYVFIVQTGYAIVNPYIAHTLHLSVYDIGLIAAVYTWSYAIFQLFSGTVLDKFRPRWVLTTSVVLVALGALCTAFAIGFGWMVLAQILLAFGGCTVFVGAAVVIREWFPFSKFNILFGLIQTVASLGVWFSQNIMNAWVHIFSWRLFYEFFSIVGGILFVLFLVFFRNYHVKQPTQSMVHTFSQVIKDIRVWVWGIIGATLFGNMLALGVIWAPKLALSQGVSHVNVAGSMVWFGAALGSVLLPRLSQWTHRKKWIVWASLLGALIVWGILLVVSLPSIWVMVGIFVLGFFSVGYMITFGAVADFIPASSLGSAMALMNAMMFIMGGLLLSLPGTLYVYFQFSDWTLPASVYVFLPLWIVLCVASIMMFWVKETTK